MNNAVLCRCAQLQQILLEDGFVKQPWQNAVHWLQNEMERVSVICMSTCAYPKGCSTMYLSSYQRPYVGTGYSYAGWSPPAQSNEASNGSVYSLLMFFFSTIQSMLVPAATSWKDPTVPN